ncbi:hypothetical protein [Kutzneria buriramensis]|uniref:Uncharacterized protein n=1 Tax=Kutzneria buriramensis TaxID=1045776 RepID=A0A3E0H7A9_9PSEU|nr:hypothetical protein [Kutzneria buriramensis]REH39178.1 hypothetical protein BCF44_11333 [Kutzneria buriramensis]
MDTQPVIELTEAQLDEVFGGAGSVVCDQTAVSPCAICVGD